MTVKIVKERFVAVAVSGDVSMGRQDAEGEFVRQSGLQLPGAGGRIVAVTAAGTQLGGVYCPGDKGKVLGDFNAILKAWDALPGAERNPGGVKVPEAGPLDKVKGLPEPPPGGLILRSYYRTLSRADDGGLRLAVATDFPNKRVQVPYVNHYGEVFEAQPDFVWLTESEWKALVPAHPKKGDGCPVPAAVSERLFRFHLIPTMAFGESAGWSRQQLRKTELNLIVDEVTPTEVRLRMEGIGRMGADYATYLKDDPKGKEPGNWAWGYEPSLLGYLVYDTARKSFTRFDVVALGGNYGTPRGASYGYYRDGRQPLGVSFEMVRGEAPADRTPPRAVMRGGGANYFATGR